MLDPRRDRLRVGPGLPAQASSLAAERLVQLPLAGALQDPGHLGQQVGPAGRELAQGEHRSGLLVRSQLMPLGTAAGLSGELGYEDTVSLRAIIGHAFEYRTRS